VLGKAVALSRLEDVEKTQHAADVSLVWFEKPERFWRGVDASESGSITSVCSAKIPRICNETIPIDVEIGAIPSGAADCSPQL
jgi:hypothetical protein